MTEEISPFVLGEPIRFKFETYSKTSKPLWIPGRTVDLDWMCTIGRIEECSKIKTELEQKLSKPGNKKLFLIESFDDMNFIVRDWKTQLKKWQYSNSIPKKNNSRRLQLANLRADRLFELQQLLKNHLLPFENFSNILSKIFFNDSKEDLSKQIKALIESDVEKILICNSIFCDNLQKINLLQGSVQIHSFSNDTFSNYEVKKISEESKRWKKLAISLITYCSDLVQLLEVIPQDLLFNCNQALNPSNSILPGEIALNKLSKARSKLHSLYIEVTSIYLDILSKNIVFLIKDFSETQQNSNLLNNHLPNYVKATHKQDSSLIIKQSVETTNQLLCFSVGFKYGRTHRYISWDMIPYIGLENLPTENYQNSDLIKYQNIFNNEKFEDIQFDNNLKPLNTLNRIWAAPEDQCVNLELIFTYQKESYLHTTIHSIEEERISYLSTINFAYESLYSIFNVQELERRLIIKGILFQIQQSLKELAIYFYQQGIILDPEYEKELYLKLENIKKELLSIPSK